MFKNRFLSMILLVGLLISQSVPPALAATSCDHAQFVSDLTIPDGSVVAPGASFTKTWRLMNAGTCTWTASYSLVWAGGEMLGAPASLALPVEVLPGQMVDVSINLTAPASAGHYKAFFKIRNATGTQFGIGDSASDPFWADIQVVEVNAVIYDFVSNAGRAQWRSGAGIIPFPGTSGDSRGFSFQVDNPHLEDDSLDAAPGLLVVPQNKFNGYIQATYPEFQVQKGDRLQTLVNCEFGAKSCYVTFRIDYLLPNGAQRTLWSWKEAYDNRFYRADLDLSVLAGQRVRFVFMLLSTGLASGDRAIWGAPRIIRMGSTQPPAPPATLTPLPPLPPTSTPIGQPPPTLSPAACDRAAFVADVTVPDGTPFSPGASFTKTWRLKNIGACAWTTAYKLVYYSGDPLSASSAVNLPWSVGFDQTVDISVNMVAPAAPGAYRGFWLLSNAKGQLFGIGANASNPIWVDIRVAGESPMGTGYDFTSNVCSAQWKSGAGALPCPGTNGSATGFVLKLDTPKLEDGTVGAPGLLVAPQNRYNGYIQGFYPAFTVQPGDRFQATVGCEFGSACYLTYRLDYMTATGYVGTFWQWREQNEGRVYHANVDLTPLAGRSVRFILTILATGYATNDRAIWGAPRIARAGTTVPTSTPTDSQTPLPPTSDWLTYTNSAYGFQFKYPPQAQISNQTNNSLRMDLPFTPGTNLREKYLEMAVRENVSPCRSPLSHISPPGSPETTVVINGISFLRQTGGDGGVGHLREWIGYSTVRNNACISMDFILHSLHAGNFETPPPEFDKAAESIVFSQMMETFVWVDPSITPLPPTVPSTVVTKPGPDQPDLTIDQMKIELLNTSCLLPDDPMGIRVWIKNNGPVAAGQFTVQANGMSSTVPALGPGETTAVFFPSYSNPVTVVVDSLNTVEESDENNNSHSEILPIPTPPLPCASPTPTDTLTPVPTTPVVLSGPYAVIGVASNDVLNIHAGAGISHPIIGSFPANGANVMRTGPTANVDNATWVEVQTPTEGTGWVNAYYLTEYVTHDAFCADSRVAVLIDQLKSSVALSNGDLFAGPVSPAHGVDVRRWAYQPAVNFSLAAARNVFSSTESYNWGTGPRGEPDVGAFKDVIQPRLAEVLSAPNVQTYCDNLTNVFPLSNPWPYTNIRFYNLYKPASSEAELDFRTWLIGFEYINNQPYLHSMVTIEWEP